MQKSFDEKLEELHKKKNLNFRQDIWKEGSQEFNQKLCIAEDLLQVTWLSDHLDHTLQAAKEKVSVIAEFRNLIEEMKYYIDNVERDKEGVINQHRLLIEKFTQIAEVYKLVDLNGAFQLLSDCLHPTKIQPMGEDNEMFHFNSKYHKLLQLPALYGFKIGANVSITKNSGSLFSEVANLLQGTIKPENFTGLEITYNQIVPFTRVKFGQEYKVDVHNENPNFLKVVALIRTIHCTLLKNIKPCEKHAIQIDKLVTYGLVIEKKFVRVLGIKAFVPQTSRTKKRYQYHLFNVGIFPFDPLTIQEKQQLDNFISFLLEASRQTIFEENLLINSITKESLGRKGIPSSIVSRTDFSQGDKLVFHLAISIDTELTTTVTLQEYLFEISTHQRRGTSPKDIFYGVLDHSSQPVFVKIFHKEKPNILDIGNIFLPHDRATLNNVDCNEYIEVSIAGDELNTFDNRTCKEKLYIITQLLLEMDHIHSKRIIHNDIKPSNIILLEMEQLTSDIKANAKTQNYQTFYCKFIDFELAKVFDFENGDICKHANLFIQSTGGTPCYNAPEKEFEGKNFIHPKTDIYTLGLIFIELILEKDIDKKQLENTEDEIWQTISIKCDELDPNKGRKMVDMLKQMLAIERKKRPTTRECLTLLEITEKADTQDHISYFFPSNREKTESKLNTNEKDASNKRKINYFEGSKSSSVKIPRNK